MLSGRLIGALVVLSFACVASAQTTPAKPKQTSKAPATGVEIETTYTTGAQISRNKTYIQGARQRFEFPGITMIAQCDLNRNLHLHDGTKRYLVVPTEAPAPVATTAAESDVALQVAALSGGAPGGKTAKPQGGVIAETITLTDTGERKEMFGLTARRIKTVITRQPGPNACATRATTVEIDAWYTDLPDHASCASTPAQAPAPAPDAQEACTDQVATQTSGDATLGFALSTAITTTSVDSKADDKDREKDKEVTTMAMEVTDLKITSLDTALFDAPADYTEVKDFTALLPSLADGGSLSDAVFGSLADGTSTVAPKNEGIIRVGVVSPSNKSGKDMPELRSIGSLLSGFTKQPFEALPVSGASPQEIDRDAASKACDYVFITDIAELKTSKPNKVGGLLKKVSGDGNSPSEIHDVRIDYKLFAVGDPVKPRVSSSVKASSGGGFGFRSALRLAYFAGTMYMTMGMGGGMGGMQGMMGMLGQSSPLGGLGGGVMGARMNPGMGAAMSIMSAGSGMDMLGGIPAGMSADASSEKALETVQEGLAKAGKQAADDLKKSKVTTARK